MPRLTWQKSTYCGSGDSCIHVAATPEAIHLTESSDPTGAILTATPATFASFLTTLKQSPLPSTPAPDTTPIHIRTAATTVTTDRAKWHAFVLGVKAGEFDHFVTAPAN
ncbi:DUF397 domain-containing protein [Streptomyces justiciae]|uniref:DUF397 domain-containing protein n=1 Tax=Streptomyces justiciae TaxID=2780140 RepID=UPI00187FC14C|nr:DUF397 domain-containing protein [Streptomyces justiciae]MBE8478177.1 DUF397 domain-containing protein [Streptomyces justiciae]MCW8375793.1 DUF397 domain-containing protein [Streptomyces justiciae]